MTFSTPLDRSGDTLVGPLRSPVQMLADQSYDDHLSVHDEATAGSLGLSGAPIEGPTHFSQFDPIDAELWGNAWFESGCISSHFSTMVVEGQQVQASATVTTPSSAAIAATRDDGETVLTGSLSITPHGTTALEERLANRRDLIDDEQFARVESYWTRSALTEKSTGRHAATVLLHSGVFKDSYPDYPSGDAA